MKSTPRNVLLFAVLGVTLSIALPRVRSMSVHAGSGNKPKADWQTVEVKAKALNPQDDQTMRSLVHEIILNNVDEEIAAVADNLETRLTKAEIKFQRGQRGGVPESNVVALVNNLGSLLGAPEYARTDGKEVRKVRMHLLPLQPHLIGRGRLSERESPGKNIGDTEMSPAEAFHVSATLITQKMFNPEYQQTPSEQSASSQARHGARWDHSKDPMMNPKTNELLELVRQKRSQISYRDILAQSERSLDLLGIER